MMDVSIRIYNMTDIYVKFKFLINLIEESDISKCANLNFTNFKFIAIGVTYLAQRWDAVYERTRRR